MNITMQNIATRAYLIAGRIQPQSGASGKYTHTESR
jgi:hypothetical protein